MKKLGVVITDGVGYRNFVLSDFLTEAEAEFEEVVILSFLPKSAYDNNRCRIIELQAYQENFTSWFFRKLKDVAHLMLHQKGNFGIQDNLNTNKSRAKTPRGYATRFIFQIAPLFASEKKIRRINSWQQATFKNNPITRQHKQLLKEENFDVLFFTHQRPPYIATLAYEAEKINLKTACFIFSWDNLASKGRMAASFDFYLVWSDLMKKELLQFYSEVKENAVHVVGTPQFEPYVLQRYAGDKASFCAKFDLDIHKKTICFSCGDISTSKNDELYIETIANAIITNQVANVNFIVRTSPAEDPIRFQSLVRKYPFIKWNYPIWNLSRRGHQEEWSQRIPSVEDVKDLRALIAFSDLNINMLSTMSLDFIQFEKPVINTVFGNEDNGLYNDQRFLKYAHIENVLHTKATKIVKNASELIEAINNYLTNPLLDAENRKALVQLQVSRPLEETGKRIALCLKNRNYEKG